MPRTAMRIAPTPPALDHYVAHLRQMTQVAAANRGLAGVPQVTPVAGPSQRPAHQSNLGRAIDLRI
jgi:hypothetical protein